MGASRNARAGKTRILVLAPRILEKGRGAEIAKTINGGNPFT
jgi:hypothetical protein